MKTKFFSEAEERKDKCTARVTTTTWADKRGLHTKKSLIFLRRQCDGFNMLEEDISMIGTDDVLPKILNFSECEDGIYEIVICNESHDFETGHIDDYDFKLVTANEPSSPDAEGSPSGARG